MSKTAFVFIDIQNDYFEGGKWPVYKMNEATKNAEQILTKARSEQTMVIHVRHESLSENAPFFLPNTTGAEIHSLVAPMDGEVEILKHRPNSFHETNLHEVLEANKITELVVCGAMSQMCIDATVRAAVDLNYKVTIIEDACGAKSLEFNGNKISGETVHHVFMASLAAGYATLMDTVSYLNA